MKHRQLRKLHKSHLNDQRTVSTTIRHPLNLDSEMKVSKNCKVELITKKWKREIWKNENLGYLNISDKLRKHEHVQNGRTKGSQTLMIELNNLINRNLLLRLAVKLKRRTKSQVRNTGTTKRHSTRTTNLHECLLIEAYAKKSGTQLVTTPYQQWCKSKNAPLETIGIVNLWDKALETSNTRWHNPWTSCSQCWTCSTAG